MGRGGGLVFRHSRVTVAGVTGRAIEKPSFIGGSESGSAAAETMAGSHWGYVYPQTGAPGDLFRSRKSHGGFKTRQVHLLHKPAAEQGSKSLGIDYCHAVYGAGWLARGGRRTRAFVWRSLLRTKEWLRFSLVPNGA